MLPSWVAGLLAGAKFCRRAIPKMRPVCAFKPLLLKLRINFNLLAVKVFHARPQIASGTVRVCVRGVRGCVLENFNTLRPRGVLLHTHITYGIHTYSYRL